ncbi:MAG: RsmD family RNA methyltransferase [Solirubrobacterales bacterium]
MRIVAGEFGGRRLSAPRGEAVRPTTDRVREALFSILGDVSGLTVLDLFAGTGALGLEAISRGAATATLVDVDVAPAAANVEALGAGDRCEVVRGDAIGFLRRKGGNFDLIFCDPPYRLARRFGSDLEELLPRRLRAGGRVIVESRAADALELGLPLLDGREYGETAIRIHGSGR